MAEAGVDGDQIVGDGQQEEGPGEEAGGGDAAAQGEGETEQSGEREEGEVEGAAGFDVPRGVGGLGDADPEEKDAAGAPRWAT